MSKPAMMLRLLSSCLVSATRAGQICRDVMSSGKLGIVEKGTSGVVDPQTEADRKAQRCIVGTIKNRFPQITVYGEESLEPSEEDKLLVAEGENADVLRETCPPEFLALEEKDVIVWVDPLDGTQEYTEGFVEHVTVLIGIAVKGEPVAGVIHRPFANPAAASKGCQQMYWALKGLGSRGVTPRKTSPPTETGSLRIVTTRSHYSDLVEATVKALGVKRENEVRVGGCGNKTMMVVEGVVDAYVYPSPGTKKWDSCAGDAIVRANGGLMTDITGQPLDYGSWEAFRNKEGLVVTMDRRTHDAVLAKIPQAVKTALAPNSSRVQKL